MDKFTFLHQQTSSTFSEETNTSKKTHTHQTHNTKIFIIYKTNEHLIKTKREFNTYIHVTDLL